TVAVLQLAEGIDLAIFESIAGKGRSRNPCEADAVVPAGDAAGATEAERLTGLVALHAAYLEAADERACQRIVEVEELLVLAEGKFIEIADNKGVRDVLVRERLLALGIEGILLLLNAVGHVDDGVGVG